MGTLVVVRDYEYSLSCILGLCVLFSLYVLFNYKLTKRRGEKPVGSGDMKITGEHKFRGSSQALGTSHQFLFYKW